MVAIAYISYNLHKLIQIRPQFVQVGIPDPRVARACLLRRRNAHSKRGQDPSHGWLLFCAKKHLNLNLQLTSIRGTKRTTKSNGGL